MESAQAGILADIPPQGRYLSFSLLPGADPGPVLQQLAEYTDGQQLVVGLGLSLLQTVGTSVAGLRDFPARSVSGIDIPSTPSALWCWLRGDDRGELLHLSRLLEELLLPAFSSEQVIDAFCYLDGRDLTGYEDGTENPEGGEAARAAVIQGQGPGMDGGSFVAVQQWWHDFDSFESHSADEQDHLIGRRLSDNEELDDAPESAHVKRTAQESFEPEAFVLRRSMPWSDGMAGGLVFTAFGHSLDAFEAQLNRMVGGEDGITDGLFRFTRPVTGAYYWCPPMKAGCLDLSAVLS